MIPSPPAILVVVLLWTLIAVYVTFEMPREFPINWLTVTAIIIWWPLIVTASLVGIIRQHCGGENT